MDSSRFLLLQIISDIHDQFSPPMNFIFHHVHKMPCQAFQQIGSNIFSRFFSTNKRYIYIKGNKFKNVRIFSKACIDRQ